MIVTCKDHKESLNLTIHGSGYTIKYFKIWLKFINFTNFKQESIFLFKNFSPKQSKSSQVTILESFLKRDIKNFLYDTWHVRPHKKNTK